MFQKAAPSVQKELATDPNVPLFHKDLTEEVEIDEVTSRPPIIQILSDDEEEDMEEVDENDLDDLPSSGESKKKDDNDDGDDSNNNGGAGNVGTFRAQASQKITQKAQEQPQEERHSEQGNKSSSSHSKSFSGNKDVSETPRAELANDQAVENAGSERPIEERVQQADENVAETNTLQEEV